MPSGRSPSCCPATGVPSTLIPVTTHRDLVFDVSRGLLYITTSGGTVERWSVANQSLLTGLSVGTSLNGADITPSGSDLYVAENQAATTTGTVYDVALATGTVTPLTYTLAFGEGGAWDVAIASNGKALLTTEFAGSG